MTATRQRPRGALYFLAIALLALAVCGPLLVRDQKNGTEDFGHFYRAAAAMRHGTDIYAATDGRYIYPPLLAFVLQPITLLPENRAIFLWLALSAAATFCAALIAARETSGRWLAPNDQTLSLHLPWLVAAGATLLTTDKLHKMFGLGQSDGFVLLGFAGILCWMNRRPLLAGVVVGAVANIKYLSAIFVPYFIAKRNYRAALSAAGSFVFFLFLPTIEVGLQRGIEYALAAFGGLSHMMGLGKPHRLQIHEVTWDRSLSITSALFRLGQRLSLPASAAALLLLFVFAATLAALVIVARRRGVRLFDAPQNSPAENRSRLETLEWAALVFCAVAFSPQTTARHMVLTLLIYTVAIPVFLALKAPAGKWALALAALLTAASLSLPSGGHALDFWRNIGGASWCALILTITLVACGSRALAARGRRAD